MKLNVSNELKSRLTHAAANGSVIAADILAEMKRNADSTEIIRGSYNYFSTKRKRTSCDNYHKIRIMFTACNKDLDNRNFPDRNNPQAPWFPENRTDIEPSTFVGLFKNLPDYPETELAYFSSAICVDNKVTVRLYEGMQDFFWAYNEENYSQTADSTESNLHSSCMRYENQARNAADFYANFAGARIMIAMDGSGNVLGRAIVWKNVHCLSENKPALSLMDRVYFSHAFVLEMIREEARSLGILLRKQYNDFSHTKELVALNDLPDAGIETGKTYSMKLAVEVPAHKWYKKGAPYMDTFYCICLQDGRMKLMNVEMDGRIATCRNTEGMATRIKTICPNCGNAHHANDSDVFCISCQQKIYSDTFFGKVLKGKTVEYQGKTYPSLLFKKKRPLPAMRTFLSINKLYGA